MFRRDPAGYTPILQAIWADLRLERLELCDDHVGDKEGEAPLATDHAHFKRHVSCV